MEKYKAEILIIGAGVAGLAAARELSKNFKNIILIEKNLNHGQEISSRNSEVIHAGIYYPKESLKSKLCIRGKELLYEYLKNNKINFNKCGKYIISTNEDESEHLDLIYKNAHHCGVDDLSYIDFSQTSYPFINAHKAIVSPSSGIFDSHDFMQTLKNEFEMNKGIVLFGNVSQVYEKNNNIEVLVTDKNHNENFVVHAKVILNCAGIEALNLAKKVEKNIPYTNKFIKGEYYLYKGMEKLDHLLYPVPSELSSGLHVTIDLGNGIRFGPSAYEVEIIDYGHNDKHKDNFLSSVKRYWPSISKNDLVPAYTGIRPSLNETNDFVINEIFRNDKVMINILGYNSPGLTASMGLGEFLNERLQDIQIN